MIMQLFTEHKVLTSVFLILIILLVVVVFNFLVIKNNGTSVPAPEIPRGKATLGSGDKLNYLIFGDSTSISQGGDYDQGYVVGTATKLAENYEVTYQNFGVSGARTNDVLQDQLTRSKDFSPDIVLIAIGANDVTHLTPLKSIEDDMNQIITELKKRNPDVKIVFTGSAAMGEVTRFPQPARYIAGLQTNRVNKVIERVAQENQVTFAYIARETGPIFRENPQFFAEDNFHPNNQGYAVWTPVLNEALSIALNQ